MQRWDCRDEDVAAESMCDNYRRVLHAALIVLALCYRVQVRLPKQD